MTLTSTNKRWITVIIVVWPSYVFVEFIFPTCCIQDSRILWWHSRGLGKKILFGGINKCSVVTRTPAESHFSHKDTKARRKFKRFEERKIKKLSVFVP